MFCVKLLLIFEKIGIFAVLIMFFVIVGCGVKGYIVIIVCVFVLWIIVIFVVKIIDFILWLKILMLLVC